MLKPKKYGLDQLIKELYVFTFIKIFIVCVIWKNTRKNSLLNGVEEKERKFKSVKSKTNKDSSSQRFHYRFPKHESMDQLEKVFVIDLETYNAAKTAEAYAVVLYNANRLPDTWNKNLTPKEVETERDNVVVFDKSGRKVLMHMIKSIWENYQGAERV